MKALNKLFGCRTGIALCFKSILLFLLAMVTTVIITFCIIILLAYLFDITAGITKIPSVILLLGLGMLLKETSGIVDLKVAVIERWLPIMGTIGLIMIVLEGSLELEMNNKKKHVIKQAFLAALVPIVVLSFVIALIFHYYTGANYRDSLINAIPFCIISSSIAIPTVLHFAKKDREFVIYESSMSDILGVLFFNAVMVNKTFQLGTLLHFSWLTAVMFAISVVAIILVALLMSNIKHHIRFVPLLILVIFVYQAAETIHLSPLIFIMLLGLVMGNVGEIREIEKLNFFPFNKLNEAILRRETNRLSDMLTEATFMVKAIFFIMFGYTIEVADLLNPSSLTWAAIISGAIYLVRLLQLLLVKIKIIPLLFIAPRGLITILLFYAIGLKNHIDVVSKSLVIQVIIITSFMMILGSLFSKKSKDEDAEKDNRFQEFLRRRVSAIFPEKNEK